MFTLTDLIVTGLACAGAGAILASWLTLWHARLGPKRINPEVLKQLQKRSRVLIASRR